MKFHKEPFSSGGLVPKSCVPVDEENLYVAGYKTIKDLRKTEPKLFLKVGDKEFLRISIPMEKNGVRFCIAARVDWWMYQHPYTQEDYWLPLAFLYFDREHYKITKEMKFFDPIMSGKVDDALLKEISVLSRDYTDPTLANKSGHFKISVFCSIIRLIHKSLLSGTFYMCPRETTLFNYISSTKKYQRKKFSLVYQQKQLISTILHLFFYPLSQQ